MTSRVGCAGHLYVRGAATGSGGSDPFTWNDTNNQALTSTSNDSASIVESTGVITLSQGGAWHFSFNASMTGGNGQVHTLSLIKDPAGAATVLGQSQRKLGTGADVGNATLLAFDSAVTAGDTYAITIAGDTGAVCEIAALTVTQDCIVT